MAEKRNITLNVKNETRGAMTLVDKGLSHGKWMIEPGSIEAGAISTYKSSGKSDTATGTTGYVVYRLWDKIAHAKIEWSIGYSTENSGAITVWGATADQFCWGLTDDSYAHIAPFSQAGSVISYWVVADKKSGTCPQSSHSVSSARSAASVQHAPLSARLKARLSDLSQAGADERSIDIAGALHAIPCGRYDEAALTRLFAGRARVSLQEVLSAEVPPIDLLEFVSSADLVPGWHAVTASAAFTAEMLGAIEEPELRGLVERAVAAVRGGLDGPVPSDIDDLAHALEAARHGAGSPERSALSAAMVEAGLALLRHKPASMLETVGASLRGALRDKPEEQAALSISQYRLLRSIVG